MTSPVSGVNPQDSYITGPQLDTPSALVTGNPHDLASREAATNADTGHQEIVVTGNEVFGSEIVSAAHINDRTRTLIADSTRANSRSMRRAQLEKPKEMTSEQLAVFISQLYSAISEDSYHDKTKQFEEMSAEKRAMNTEDLAAFKLQLEKARKTESWGKLEGVVGTLVNGAATIGTIAAVGLNPITATAAACVAISTISTGDSLLNQGKGMKGVMGGVANFMNRLLPSSMSIGNTGKTRMATLGTALASLSGLAASAISGAGAGNIPKVISQWANYTQAIAASGRAYNDYQKGNLEGSRTVKEQQMAKLQKAVDDALADNQGLIDTIRELTRNQGEVETKKFRNLERIQNGQMV